MANVKYLSEIEKYEIININDGEKYSSLSNNDIIVDENGDLRYLIINLGSGKFSLFSQGDEYLEIAWEKVKRIGAKTIILDVEQDEINAAVILHPQVALPEAFINPIPPFSLLSWKACSDTPIKTRAENRRFAIHLHISRHFRPIFGLLP